MVGWLQDMIERIILHVLNKKRTNVTLQPNVVPQMVPKKSFSKIVNLELSSNVPAMCIVIQDQKLHTCEH